MIDVLVILLIVLIMCSLYLTYQLNEKRFNERDARNALFEEVLRLEREIFKLKRAKKIEEEGDEGA